MSLANELNPDGMYAAAKVAVSFELIATEKDGFRPWRDSIRWDKLPSGVLVPDLDSGPNPRFALYVFSDDSAAFVQTRYIRSSEKVRLS